jgi:hypothetical protein
MRKRLAVDKQSVAVFQGKRKFQRLGVKILPEISDLGLTSLKRFIARKS